MSIVSIRIAFALICLVAVAILGVIDVASWQVWQHGLHWQAVVLYGAFVGEYVPRAFTWFRREWRGTVLARRVA